MPEDISNKGLLKSISAEMMFTICAACIAWGALTARVNAIADDSISRDESISAMQADAKARGEKISSISTAVEVTKTKVENLEKIVEENRDSLEEIKTMLMAMPGAPE